MNDIKLNGRSPEAVEFRADRVMRAARELALEGGYEAVQMREVAKRAQVALATLYRYYPSKDDLLLAVINREIGRFGKEMGERPADDQDPKQRAADTLIRAFRGIIVNRGFAHAIMRSYHVAVPYADSVDRAGKGEILSTWPNEFLTITAQAAWGDDHVPTLEQYQALHILEAVWAGSLIGWLNSTLSQQEVETRLTIAAIALLGD